MTKRSESKFRIERRLRCNLWGRAKSSWAKRSSRPGQHGGRPKRMSDYALQLQAKQRLRFYYDLQESKFRRIYNEAVRLKGDTGENLIGLLERRLITVVYRMKLVPTIFAARQLVSHCKILVNGKRVNVGSYLLRPGDKISLHESMRDNAVVVNAIASGEREIPSYYEFNAEKREGVFVRVPVIADVPFAFTAEPHLVVEYYSR